MAHFPSRQPGQLTNNKERGTIVPQDAEWRILAEEAAQENDPRKLMREFRPHGKELNSAPSTAKRRQSSIDSLRRTMMSPLRRALWNVPPRHPGHFSTLPNRCSNGSLLGTRGKRGRRGTTGLKVPGQNRTPGAQEPYR
jgi:hypothetical protein